MRRFLSLLGMLSVALAVFVPMSPAQASWVSDHCINDNYDDSNVRRADAQAYAAVADNEGYEWGGGCWNNNDVDDTPNQPDSSGEGPDCSGLVFKTWEMKNSYGTSGWRYWNKMQSIHGPYISDTFHDVGTSSDLPFKRLPDKKRSTTLYMDAFAKDGHVGLLYTSSNPSDNLDYIIEALGDAPGTDINEEGYRFDDAYRAVRRKDWTSDCYPNCLLAPVPRVVVIA
ncbi:MAG TPA: hypothetical protein VF972_08785 [Actinomycetota bacterium]